MAPIFSLSFLHSFLDPIISPIHSFLSISLPSSSLTSFDINSYQNQIAPHNITVVVSASDNDDNSYAPQVRSKEDYTDSEDDTLETMYVVWAVQEAVYNTGIVAPP